MLICRLTHTFHLFLYYVKFFTLMGFFREPNGPLITIKLITTDGAPRLNFLGKVIYKEN